MALAFLTTHALVLLAVDRHPDVTIREFAVAVGISERQVHRVLDELEAGGYVTRIRAGRRNLYTIDRGRPAHDDSISEIGHLLDVFQTPQKNP